ncbi:hypothetical protein PIB30_030216 [Stylosanthes scabra]|uniref:Uncharacterized protein n=1 Tax=Stylosanthes scabra TaxID=79078 RepID=A0ABU6UBB8_9FABA|nr:hypothetical protein [Stylosanthes scabra]
MRERDGSQKRKSEYTKKKEGLREGELVSPFVLSGHGVAAEDCCCIGGSAKEAFEDAMVVEMGLAVELVVVKDASS